ncbi:DUF262 domain-containing protein [Chryseobacterium sp. YR221]|uniref:DUF262 domain-containing protein n=1 Tax=Chryseobacterium sp. YR221 TaxID=1500293 RepID=UPI0009D808C2|nr:DUF262 domain-containing protein [Chryseobacterium sp. YR221]SMC95716.1 Protein of unknown function [Chryseobacterium sp. YR221]
MAELIYNVKNLFSTDTEGCLLDYDVQYFHIAAYQRGYKWGSDKNGAVSILLEDLWVAFCKSRESKVPIDYYLQYITLKKNNQTVYLEVIDGQQRLTTLSILLSTFSFILNESNISNLKLDYAVRSNFFQQYIYNKDQISKLFECSWDKQKGLLVDNQPFNDQDTYYIFCALQKCHQFINEIRQDDIKDFYDFVLNQVQIIVNVVEHVNSEKIFSNLNSNKIPLTETELIKALFITKYARLNESLQKKTFREIQEQRLILGKRWDEIENWVNTKEIKSFFFGKFINPMFGFLVLVAKTMNTNQHFQENTNHHELFNFFNQKDIRTLQEELYNSFWGLKDWFKTPIIHNRLGYLFFHRGSNLSIINFANYLKCLSKNEFHKHLLEKIIQVIPIEFDEINYEDSKDDIHKILLALSVFSSAEKFNFYSYINEKWTLEHIFPQSPEGKKNVLAETDKANILEMIKAEDKNYVSKVLKKPERTKEEKEVYTDAIQRSGYIHHLGNMCLLSNVDNILNGCGFYDEKRTKILNRIKSGGFIPSHTIEVFTKSMFETDPDDFTRWTKTNIDSHKIIIKNRIMDLNNDLKKQQSNESR